MDSHSSALSASGDSAGPRTDLYAHAARPPKPRWSSCIGAGALIAVGYMDPGNWATALESGARYGYRMLSVVLAASLMGLLLQWIASTVGVVTGHDLSELCRRHYSHRTTLALWITSEIAIVACDVAEVVGSAVALQLLLGVSLKVGVLLSGVGTFAMLALQRRGQRPLQVTVTLLILFVGICFVIELALAEPAWHGVLAGLMPRADMLRDTGMVWLAVGILGATVMPHNLYLHSALVKKHAVQGGNDAISKALRSVNIDTLVSLTFAFVVNAALLIVAAAVFHARGHVDLPDLADASRLIAPLLGSHAAGVIFAAALLACGLNATVTGTLAGQVVMEGFLRLKISGQQRALLTRGLAIGPALLAIAAFRQRGSSQLLIASQVVLSLQLPMAVIPLVSFAASNDLMGCWRLRHVPLALAWLCAAVVVALNAALLWQWATNA